MCSSSNPRRSRGNFIGLPANAAQWFLGLGGVRKARIANPGRGKGKRGGYRYLYLYLESRRHIHLLLLLDKNEQEDASEEQRK
jgi:hypothetical protein